MEAVVIALLVSTLATTGLVALAAATSRGHWFLRTTVFLAVIAPLLAIPAYEPFVTLALQGATIAVGVYLARRRKQRRLARERAASPQAPIDLAADAAAYALPRFRIATLLLATVLFGIAATVAARMPALNVPGWQSLVAVGVGAGLATLLGGYAASRRGWRKLGATLGACALATGVGVALMSLDWLVQAIAGGSWPPNPNAMGSLFLPDETFGAEWLIATPLITVITTAMAWFFVFMPLGGLSNWRGRVATALAAMVVVVVAAPAGLALWKMLTPPAIPVAQLPQPNGFDDLTEAGRLTETTLANSANFDEDTATHPQLAQAAGQAAAAIALARQSLERDCLVPVNYLDGNLFTPIQQLRSLSRAMSATGRSALESGDVDAALANYLDCVHLGVKCRRGGLLIDGLVGVAITGVGQCGIHRMVDRLSAEQCRATISELRKRQSACEPSTEFVRRDRIWTAHAMGWVGRLYQIADDISQFEEMEHVGLLDPRGYATPFKREQALTELLAARLALRAYEIEHGAIPKSWDDIVAAGGSPLALDPFDPQGGALRFLVTDDGPVLYSVGTNQIDEGGLRAKDSYGWDPTQGDLRLDAHWARDDSSAGATSETDDGQAEAEIEE